MIPHDAVNAVAKHNFELNYAEVTWADLADDIKAGWLEEAQAQCEAAAPFLRAQALEDAADEWERRSETFLRTMQNMSELIGTYTHDDIIRYGAYSAEANTTAHRLRSRAATERGQHD